MPEFDELEAKKTIMAMLISHLPGDTTLDTFENIANSTLAEVIGEWREHDKRRRPKAAQSIND